MRGRGQGNQLYEGRAAYSVRSATAESAVNSYALGRRAVNSELIATIWLRGTRTQVEGVAWKPKPAYRLIAETVAGLTESGDPDWARTNNLQLRRLTLYPIELRGHRRPV